MSMRSRKGLTSIELLVVMALIAILGSLIFAGIQALRGKQMNTTTQVEIREMTAALENFKAKYNVYPPSSLTVAPTDAGLDANSKRILYKIWPSLNVAEAFGTNGWGLTGPVTLKGDQCLVLFLGGRHDAGGAQGFSTSPVNPFLAGGDRHQPFFNFKGNRLYKRDSSPFHSYGDGWFKMTSGGVERFPCYAYFSPTVAGYSDADCSTLSDFDTPSANYPKPYKNSAGKYLNPQSFQILSSGRDLLWGAAQVWESGVAITDGKSSDNIANFANGLLSGN